MSAPALELLWPRPRSILFTGGSVPAAGLGDLLHDSAGRIDRSLPPQGYLLELNETGSCRLIAADDAGLFYGRQTLRQLLELCRNQEPAGLPACTIRDAPSRERRGVMLDVSRNKVPTLETLKNQIERLSRLKINELHLYFEHTFAYTGAESVWGEASPYTAADVQELDAFCRERFVDLVPNQQSFGHLHRWLTREEYRHLAELPEGIEHAFSLEKEPYGLCATNPESLRFLETLYDELLPNFSSTFFHVGLDETIDLGLGPSKPRCDEIGKARVHLEFLLAVEERVRSRGRRMMYWADEQEKSNDLRQDLPPDAVACVWGYEAGDPLLEKSAVFAEEGIDLVLCPGTSSWQSFGGRTDNLFANLREANVAAKAQGALGLLVCDWGDRGHFQPYAIAEAGWTLGAGLGWNDTATDAVEMDETAARLVSLHAFGDSTGEVGRWLQRLGRIDSLAGGCTTNGASLFFTVFFALEPFPHERTPGLHEEGVRLALFELAELEKDLENLPLGRQDDALLRRELRQVIHFLTWSCRLASLRLALPAGSPLNAIAPAARHDLAAQLEEILLTSFAPLWLDRNRPGGLKDSRHLLERVVVALKS